MAHPKRAEWAEQLAAKLGCPIVWDEIGSPWDTGRRALLTTDPAASHHVIVQDDAIVCEDLPAALEQAVAYAGQRPIGLYLGARPHHRRVRLSTKMADKRGRPWIAMDRATVAGVASAHPVTLIEQLAAFNYRDSRSWDSRYSAFYRELGVTPWFTWPSLVEHRPGPSLLPNHPKGRTAVRFLGENTSALGIDWSRSPQIAPP
jgi:hypothetical protein